MASSSTTAAAAESTTSNESNNKKIVLRSSDGELFEVSEALQSQMIKNMINEGCVDDAIRLPNVTSPVLSKVVEYCSCHVDSAAAADGELKTWDAEFVKVDQGMLFDTILAANYLNIKDLLDLTCQTVADMIKGKSVKEIRKTFNNKNDFTP